MTLLTDDIEKLLKEALETCLGKATPPNLREAIAYSLLSPGKRIRPRLALASAEMLGLKDAQVAPAALALEMIHCFTLIHDDLPCMDNDDFRRGIPSSHKKFGEAMALLAGDALIPAAIETFMALESQVSADRLHSALRRLLWAAGPRGVIGGQAAEPLLKRDSDLSELTRMFDQKTGALFSAAILVPMDLAGITDDSEKGMAIELFARELGFAFQVADDLEDAGDQKPEPTSILHFLSKKDAQDMTSRRLLKATESLTTIWGDRAKRLVQIAHEVLRKLESA